MGIQGVAPHRKPAPKATCSQCGRPVAILKSGRCSYCGAAAGEGLPATDRASALPPEVLIALEPRAAGTTRNAVWARRLLSLGALGLLVALFAGTCMKS